jgi:hypothetical protein
MDGEKYLFLPALDQIVRPQELAHESLSSPSRVLRSDRLGEHAQAVQPQQESKDDASIMHLLASPQLALRISDLTPVVMNS